MVRWARTPRKMVASAIDQLRLSGAEIAGVVLSQVNLRKYAREYRASSRLGYPKNALSDAA
jgi:Mrp family chromosome partitioning ATPase